jgi:hypothetical protein
MSIRNDARKGVQLYTCISGKQEVVGKLVLSIIILNKQFQFERGKINDKD